jgi:hypothetical protein
MEQSSISRWNDILGPFYSADQVVKIWGGVSKKTLADWRGQSAVLGLETTDGFIVYPTFQFDEKNRVLRGLPEVLQCFHGINVDDWTVAGWLVSPSRALGSRSVVDWLRLNRELEPVLVLARESAWWFAESALR